MAQSKKQEELDVDIRFLLANERTLLAWIRTSLTVEAGGIALATVHKNHEYVGVVVLLLGAIVALISYHRYQATEHSIRDHHLPPTGRGPALQVYGIVAVAIILAIAQLTILK